MRQIDHRFVIPSKHISNKSMEVDDSLDVSAQPMEDLKFMQASNVNVFNFVSVKDSSNNYHIWKGSVWLSSRRVRCCVALIRCQPLIDEAKASIINKPI
ncbi:hypothetical protein Tco_0586265 [Tanacetum coccineum]